MQQRASKRDRRAIMRAITGPAAALVLLNASSAHAANRYWDFNGTANGAGSASPTGAWTTSDAVWNQVNASNQTSVEQGAAGTLATSAWTNAGANATDSANHQAIFSAGSDATGAYTATVSGTIFARGIIVQDGSLTIAGGTTPALQVANGITIDNTVSGATTLASSLGTTTIASSQTWANNSSFAFNVNSAVTSVSTTAAAAITLTGTGSNTFTGVISNNATAPTLGTLGITVNTTSGTTKLTAANTYNGNTILTRGNLHLDFSAAGAPEDNIINNDEVSLTSGSALTLGDGTLTLTGKALADNDQQFNGTTFSANSGSNVTIVQNGASDFSVTLGGLTRNTGSTVNFTLPTTGTISAATSTNNNNTLLSNSSGTAYASANGTTWATMSSGTIGALASYASTYDTGGANNVDVTTSNSSPAAFTVNSLRFNTAATTLTLASGNNTLDSGGVLVTAATTGTGNGAVINGPGVLRSGSATELVILNYGQLNVATPIVNSASGNSNLTLSGTGVTTLSGANTFTSGTSANQGVSILQGTVKAGVSTIQGTSGALGPGNNNTWVMSTATLDLNGFNVGVGQLNGTGTVTNTGAAASLTVGNNNAASTFSGLLTGSNFSLIKTGTGTLSLANNANSFNGLTVNAGTVLASTQVLGSNAEQYANPTSMGTPFGTGTVTLNGGAITANINGGGPSGANFNFGELATNIAVGTSGGTVNHGGTNRAVMVYTGLISGTGKLTLANGIAGSAEPNAMILKRSNNAYTGGTELRALGAGTSRALFLADGTNALGGGTSGTGGVVSFSDLLATTTINSTLTLKGDQTVAGLASTRALGAVTGFSASTTSVLTINNSAGGVGDGSSFATPIGSALTANIGAGAGTGVASGYAAGNNIKLVKTGTGTQILSTLNSYSGGTEINGGTLLVNGGATQAGASRSVAYTAGSRQVTTDTTGLMVGQFVFGTGNATTPQIVGMSGGTLILSEAPSSGTSFSFSSVGSGAGQTLNSVGATSSGATTLTLNSVAGLAIGQYVSVPLSGSNTRLAIDTQIVGIDTGTNTITLSKAVVSGQTIPNNTAITIIGTSGTGTGAVTVNNTGTLGGNGATLGVVTINGGGHIAPGNSIGTLTTGGVSFVGAASLDVEIDLAANAADRLISNGAVNLGTNTALLDLDITGTTTTPLSFLILQNQSLNPVSGYFAGLAPNGDGRATYTQGIYTITVDYADDVLGNGNDISVTVAVPEPASLSALLLAGAGLLSRRRRGA